ncbi:hypothetical protein JZ751_013781, partial [Albula glossodonta]
SEITRAWRPPLPPPPCPEEGGMGITEEVAVGTEVLGREHKLKSQRSSLSNCTREHSFPQLTKMVLKSPSMKFLKGTRRLLVDLWTNSLSAPPICRSVSPHFMRALPETK